MEWNIPKTGDKRIIKRFALFPIHAGNSVRWLERCNIEQQYLNHWNNLRFVDKSDTKQTYLSKRYFVFSNTADMDHIRNNDSIAMHKLYQGESSHEFPYYTCDSVSDLLETVQKETKCSIDKMSIRWYRFDNTLQKDIYMLNCHPYGEFNSETITRFIVEI